MTLAAKLVIREAQLARPITSARGTWTSRRGVLLVLGDGSNRVGRGEASPLPGYSPDDTDACARAMREVAVQLGADDEALPPSVAPLLAGLPAARFALDTALADLAAQRRGVALAQYLAGAPTRSSVARSGLVDLSSPVLVDDVRACLSRGVLTVKAKIGARHLADDLRALARLRATFGHTVRLRLDANGAFDREGARTALAELARYEPELVEEPTSGADLVALGACPVPWAADESLQDARIAGLLLDTPCAAFVVKPAVFGLHAARALAIAAQARGKDVIVTHLFDGPVALAAAAELALSLPEPPLACGLDLHAGLAVWGAMRIPQLENAGIVTSHQGAGLGVT